MDINHLDTLEMSLYLSVTNKRDELVSLGLGDHSHQVRRQGPGDNY